MRLQQYINEVAIPQSKIDEIQKDCEKYIDDVKSISGKIMLYRGERGSIKNWTDKTPRTDRSPRDTPQQVHDILDKLFSQKFGWKVRSEAVFCTTDKWQADIYGKKYHVLPVGKYELIYSEEAYDLTVYLREKEILVGFMEGDRWKYGLKDEHITPEELERLLKPIVQSYKKINDIGLLPSEYKGEVSLRTSKYYLTDIKTDSFLFQKDTK